MPKYLLAHDLGTSGNKATLFTTDGLLVNSYTYEYPLYMSNGNWAEQDADDWWKAVCETTKELTKSVNPSDILAVSFSGQMMGCLCVDKNGTPLRKSLIWADMRSSYEEDIIRKEIDDKKYYKVTGNRLSPSYSATKLMWIKNNEPQIYKNTYKVLNSKDYIILKLTGNFVTDYSDASLTGLLDITTKKWSEEILSAGDLDASKLPDILLSTDVAGKVTKEASALTGLTEGTLVICGGGDGTSAAVGSGATKEGVANCSLGTSSWVSFASKTPVFSPEMLTFNMIHMVPNYYVPCGTMQCGGGSLSWIVRELYKDSTKSKNEIYSEVNQLVKESGIGAKGLLFLPYLIGERSPRWNPNAKGSFIGLTFEHTKADMLRAVMEGVVYNLNIVLNEFQQNGGNIKELTLLGGGARNPEWCKIFAEVFNIPIILPNHLEAATSMGAAITAGVGAGAFKDFDALSLFLEKKTEYLSTLKDNQKYTKMQKLFDESYYALKNIFDKI